MLKKILVHMKKGHGDCKMKTDETSGMKSHMKNEHEREEEKLKTLRKRLERKTKRELIGEWRKSCKRKKRERGK